MTWLNLSAVRWVLVDNSSKGNTLKINSFKELEQLVKLCRKTGIATFKGADFEFTLGPEKKKTRTKPEPLQDPIANARVPAPNIFEEKLPTPKNQVQAVADQIATDGLTDEQLLFYSARQEPETDQPQWK